ncbi:MAG: patatin-like phospholipase family protein [Pseudomonadota bacterium]
MKLKEKTKIGLALSGGGIKAAAFHIGVCLALKEKGFRFAGGTKNEVASRYPDDDKVIRLYVGSSAGAVISTFLASGYSLEAIISAFERGAEWDLKGIAPLSEFEAPLKPLAYTDIFSINGRNWLKLLPRLIRNRSILSGGFEAMLKNLLKINGFVTAKGLEKYIREEVWPENSFDTLGVELYIVATQLNHSRKVIFGNFPETSKGRHIGLANYAKISEAVAASASLPPVFAPFGIVNERGKEIHYFDGEIRDTLSTHVAKDNGCDLVIASYSIQPYHYNENMGSLHEYGIPLIANQALYQVVQQKIDAHIAAGEAIDKIYHAIRGYFKSKQLPEEDMNKLLGIIEERTDYRPNVDTLYIHPNPHDYEMFFADHFSLNPKILSKIVQTGFRSAINVLRKHDL